MALGPVFKTVKILLCSEILLTANKTKVLAMMMSNEKELPMISNEMAGGDCSEHHLCACQIY